MSMFIMYIYNDVVKASLGKEADKYAPYLLTCFFFIFIANMMGVMPFPPGGGNLTKYHHHFLPCYMYVYHNQHNRNESILERYFLAGSTNVAEDTGTDAIH